MASPHIAGLLAYLLSLQPAKDSAYAVADITPKKLKSQLISIGTEGVLTDVPSSTKNILAWNGGGESNYTSIIGKGGYVAKVKPASTSDFTEKVSEVAQSLEELEQKLEKDVKDFLREMKSE